MSGASPSVYKGRMKDDLFSMIDETPSDLRCECFYVVQRTLVITTLFVTKDFAVKVNLLL